MIGRYAFSIAVGSFITLSLIFVMHLLIEHAEDAIQKGSERTMLDFVRIKRNETLNTEDYTPEKPLPPPEVPPDVPPQDLDQVDPNAPTINIPAPDISTDTNIGGPGGMNIAEGDYLPIVRVAPVYPARAQSRGVEGYVDMEFTVTVTGSVINPIVVFSTSSLFERAASKAVQKFKYKPRVVDGVPVEVSGVTTRIRFELED